MCDFFHQANKAMDFLQIITIITIYLFSESDDDNSHRQVISLVFILKSTKQCNDLKVMVIILSKFGSGIHHCIIAKTALFIMVYKYSFNISNKSMKQYGNVPFLYKAHVLLFFGSPTVSLSLLRHKSSSKYCAICL